VAYLKGIWRRESPEITDEVRIETAERYITASENITGNTYVPQSGVSEANEK
jgi:hypothetical protein